VLAEVARRGWLWIAAVSAVTLWALLAQHPVLAGIGRKQKKKAKGAKAKESKRGQARFSSE
jgi:hypothetical protein